jgi:hypothetical protein
MKPMHAPTTMDASMADTISRLRPNRIAPSLPATLANVPMRPSPVAIRAGDSKFA